MKTILIIEDDALNQRFFYDVLGIYGARPLQAYDAQEALTILKKITPDLILMDIQLPRVSGIELTKQIRSIPHLKDIPIIATTAFAFEEKEDQLLQLGFNKVLFKPVHIKELKKLCE